MQVQNIYDVIIGIARVDKNETRSYTAYVPVDAERTESYSGIADAKQIRRARN
jgi:hypothetical protein